MGGLEAALRRVDNDYAKSKPTMAGITTRPLVIVSSGPRERDTLPIPSTMYFFFR